MSWLSVTNNSNAHDIRRAQSLLNVHPSGQFGPGMAQSVSDFQAENKLTVDGMIGPATWSALEGTAAPKPKKAPAKKKADVDNGDEAKAAAPTKKTPAKKKAAAKK